MVQQFHHVPKEVQDVIGTGIFWINYTHLTAARNRKHIARTKKIMAPSVALGEDIITFSGEPDFRTIMLRHFYVSVSDFPDSSHNWKMYTPHAGMAWTPESSAEMIKFFEEEKARLQNEPMNLASFVDPSLRPNIRIKLDEAIEYERKRQKAYLEMSEEQRTVLMDRRVDVYGFQRIPAAQRQGYGLFGGNKDYHLEHSVVPAEIHLGRYLKGMFTERELVPETRAWIAQTLGREVPVASLDALATWEEVYPQLPTFTEQKNKYGFYAMVSSSPELQQRVIQEVQRI